jgi:hypothetical protein
MDWGGALAPPPFFMRYGRRHKAAAEIAKREFIVAKGERHLASQVLYLARKA